MGDLLKPSDYLQQSIIAKPVIVKLNNGVVYKGTLARYIFLFFIILFFQI